ncbi:MAG: hypothetical protein IRY83_09915 [Chloroflexi bacterium]|nr:hypothetical protein [Chloroflexota bacterium]
MGRIVDLAHGGLAGLVGTLLMTGVILAGRAGRLFRGVPPAEITARAEEQTGLVPGPSFSVTWLLAHLGYGTVAGAVYALGRRGLGLALPVPLAGLLDGALVWAFSYLGIMPALGLYPWPREDRPGRLVTMLIAHSVYGLATAGVYDWLVRHRRAHRGAALGQT